MGAFEITCASTSMRIKVVIFWALLGMWTSATAGIEIVCLSPRTLLCRVRTLTCARVVAEIFRWCALLNPFALALTGSGVEEFEFGARLGLSAETTTCSVVEVLVRCTC